MEGSLAGLEFRERTEAGEEAQKAGREGTTVGPRDDTEHFRLFP